MELHVYWIFIPILLIGCIFYSMVRSYIYGRISVAITIVISFINLLFYIHSFLPFYTLPLGGIFSILVFLFLAWIFDGCFLVYRQFKKENDSIVICLILNIFLILVWNVLILTSNY